MKTKFFLLSALLFISFTFYSQGKFDSKKLEELQQSLDSIIAPVRDKGIKISTKVVHADYNKNLFEYKPEEPMIPASITKLVICAAAFTLLGQDYNIPTVIYTDDNNFSDGIINGNIYIKGFGDPDFNSSDVKSLSDHLLKLKIREITGNIVADESYFDSDYYTLQNDFSGDTGPSYWPYVSGLCLDKGKSASYAGSLLSSLLTSGGVTLGGSVIAGVTPKGSKEVVRISHSLFDVLANMCKESDNHSAITIFKLVGAKQKSEPGSIEKGQEAIEGFLTELGVSRYSYDILEGSGLTRYNKVNAEMYIKILKSMYDDKFLFDYFMNTLSVTGKDGTLKNRMTGTSAEGNVFAKTGTLNGVSALSGYVVDKDSEVLIFYIVMNSFGGNANSMRSVQDDFCVRLSVYSRQ